MSTRPIDVQRLTQSKVTVPVVMLLGILVLGWRMGGVTVDYLDDFFVLKADAAEQYEGISGQVRENQALLVSHVSEYKLNENAKALRAAQDALFELEFHVEQNGVSDLTRSRKRSLNGTVARLGRVRNCIVTNQHLSEGEPVINCDAII